MTRYHPAPRRPRGFAGALLTRPLRTRHTHFPLTHLPIKLVCGLAMLSAGAVAVSGCGNSVPANGVAKVGGTVITKADFKKWLNTAALGQAQGAQASVPDPPKFTNCIAGKR